MRLVKVVALTMGVTWWEDKCVDAKYFDDVAGVMKDLLDGELQNRGKGPNDNVAVAVSSLNLRSLLDYCAILRPLLDAVELGEVEQYKKGLEDGRREGKAMGRIEGRDATLEEVAQGLLSSSHGDCSDAELADYLRSMMSTAGMEEKT